MIKAGTFAEILPLSKEGKFADAEGGINSYRIFVMCFKKII